MDAYSGMELCTPTWLNYDYGDGGVADILAVDAYSRVELCLQIIFEKKIITLMDTSLSKAQHKQELLWKIFGSGRNVYVVEEPSKIHSTPINLKIKFQQD
jgi:hypothetical protein